MKIGIDARALSRTLTGIGYYLLEVIKALKKLDVEITLFSPAPLMIPADVSANLTVIAGSCTRGMHRVLWSELKLPLLLKQYRQDIFWGPAHRLPVFISRTQATLLTIHDLAWRQVPDTMRLTTKWQETLFMPLSLNRADMILADSMATHSDLKAYKPQISSRIRYVPAGCRTGLTPSSVPPDNALPATLAQTVQSKPYILCTGTIEPRKNLVRLLKAFRALPTELQQKYHLIIAGGEGWGKVNLQQEIIKYGLEQQVSLTGYLPDAALSVLYQHAYCLAMPSLYEGFGLPILEAHACGVPVITADHSSMPEVAGNAAILVNPCSVASITDGLRQLLDNQPLRQDLSVKAVQNAAKYSWEKTAQLIVNACKETIQAQKHR